jgi:parallel beta-helix repeat protein
MFASKLAHAHRRVVGLMVALTVFLSPLLSAANGSVRAAPAYTEVGGPIISDATWTLANSPYIVVANVEVWQGVTLTIQPGVVVKFNKDKLLQVNGTLIARGNVANPITFTSNQASSTKGDWKNIKFTDSSTDATFDGAVNYIGGSILEYCMVEYGGNGVGGAVQTDQASPLIDHCTVQNNLSSGIHAVGTSDTPIVIRNNTVSGNFGGGIVVSYSTVMSNMVGGNSGGGNGGGIAASSSLVMSNIVSGNSASGGGGGIFASSGSAVTGNVINNNSAGGGGGISAMTGSTVTGNTVSGNSAKGPGGGIVSGYLSAAVTDNTVSGNSASGNGGGIYAQYGSVVTGNILSGNSTGGNGGGICAENSTVTGNTFSGNSAVSGKYGYGGGIDAGYGTVTGNIISGNLARYGGGIYAYGSPVISNTVTANTATVQGSGVYFEASDDFSYNTIVGNAVVSPTVVTGGVVIDKSMPQVHHNNLYGNANYDVVVLFSGDISGTHNYWGTVATVDILAHVYDWYDNSARGRLLFIPYIQDPDPNAPAPPPQNLRATFAGSSASLSWDAIPSTTTGYGYKIYYDTDASGPPYHGTGATQGDSPVDVGNATQFTLSGLGGGGVYIAVTAYDTQGRESWYSNEVSRWRTYLPAVLKR